MSKPISLLNSFSTEQWTSGTSGDLSINLSNAAFTHFEWLNFQIPRDRRTIVAGENNQRVALQARIVDGINQVTDGLILIK